MLLYIFLSLNGSSCNASNFTSGILILILIYEQDLSFNFHILQPLRTAFFHFRNIAKIRNILSQKDAEELVHSFATSRLDYLNSLLSALRLAHPLYCLSHFGLAKQISPTYGQCSKICYISTTVALSFPIKKCLIMAS